MGFPYIDLTKAAGHAVSRLLYIAERGLMIYNYHIGSHVIITISPCLLTILAKRKTNEINDKYT